MPRTPLIASAIWACAILDTRTKDRNEGQGTKGTKDRTKDRRCSREPERRTGAAAGNEGRVRTKERRTGAANEGQALQPGTKDGCCNLIPFVEGGSV